MCTKQWPRHQHRPSPLRRIPTASRPLEGPERVLSKRVDSRNYSKNHLNCALIAATGNAFTIVLAGFALTLTSLPKAILLPAFWAGLLRVLIMHTPGMTNLPAFFTSAVARAAKLSMTAAHSFGFSSFSSANAAAIAPFVIAFAPAFIAF